MVSFLLCFNFLLVGGRHPGAAVVMVTAAAELLEPPLQAVPLGAEARVVAQHAVAVPDGAVEAVEQVAVVGAEVGSLRPELAELPLLAHARPPRRLPVGRRPPPPPLLRELLLLPPLAAASLVFRAARARHAVVVKKRVVASELLLAVRGGGVVRRQ